MNGLQAEAIIQLLEKILDEMRRMNATLTAIATDVNDPEDPK